MPLVTVLAPGTRVVVPGMHLPGATVEQVVMRSGVNPLTYHLTWKDSVTKAVRRCSFRGDRVIEVGATPEPALPQTGRLSELGALFAAAEAANGG